MTIEIKNRWDDRVLYTAENAQDVRAAVVEAVARGANLGDAYLRDAYLGGANLRDANLRGANLRGANLGDAYLRDAYLGGANLGDAYLRGANLRGANLGDANLGGANLRDANLRGANLRGANLRDAYLRGAYLGGAYLRGANLRGANLGDANLGGANLRDAKGLNPYLTTPLHLLADQPGAIRLYKLVTAGGVGPMNGGITYAVGGSYEVANANGDPNVDCGAGINVATLDWCLGNYQKGWRILLVEFTAADIACIPHATSGKIRLHRCTVVGEKTLDEVGLGAPESEAVAS